MRLLAANKRRPSGFIGVLGFLGCERRAGRGREGGQRAKSDAASLVDDEGRDEAPVRSQSFARIRLAFAMF
jgi:hypothetical protein